MSTTKNHPRQSEEVGAITGDASTPAAKRQKVESPHSLLLDTIRSDILRKVCSFLTLKEAVVLRRACRQFNKSSKDLYECSIVMERDDLTRRGFTEREISKYMRYQIQGFCNLPDGESLWAVLRNKTLPSRFVGSFIYYLID